ncbi:MAG TPA: peptidylprolyl isomerase, partial [Steroidobacteraceae bacterium]|nr:peptidylprolyl isomerase [Steroidobacteraceae bacterium]
LPDVAAGLAISDAQLRERYEKDKDRYVQPETRHARHILVAVDDTTDDAKAAAQAKELHDRLKGGADFAALAKQYSKDSVSAQQGGDLGWSGRDVYVKEFADKLFSMKEGETSEPVKTQFGYHIIRLEGIRAGAGRSFEDVRAELAATMRTELAGKEFTTREDQLQEKLEQGGSNLDQLVKEFGLTRGTIERFERGAGGLPLGSDAELNRMVFSDATLNQRRVGGPVQLGEDRITVFQVAAHTPASTKPLAEVRDTITAAIRRERGATAAQAAADAAVARLKAGARFDAVLAELKVKADPARFVARSAPDVPVQLRNAAFAGVRPTADKPHVEAVKMDGGAVALLTVTGSRVQSLTSDPQLQQLRAQRELQRYSVRDLDAYVGDVVSAAKVRKNPQAFQQ